METMNLKLYVKQPMDFEELCKTWLQSKQLRIKHSTYEKYEYLLGSYIIPKMGNISIKNINLIEIEERIRKIYYEKNNRLSVSTMKSVIYIVNAVLNYGTRLQYFQIQKAVFELPKTSEKEIIVLSKQEEFKLIDYLYHHITENSLGIMIALFTGMRLGEICSLQKKDIDFTNEVISVKKTVQRLKEEHDGCKTELIVTTPKSNKSLRDIPIPVVLKEYFKWFKIDRMIPENYVLSQNNFPYEPRTLQYAFEAILKKCDIRHVGFHCLRHTFATNCVKAGFDVKTLSEILGHTSVSFTLNRYVHTDMDHKRTQMDLLSAKYCEISSVS